MEREAAVAVFGGTGFLGRAVVQHLVDKGYRVRAASRRPDRMAGSALWSAEGVEPIQADVRDEASVGRALAGCQAAVNAVGLYIEEGEATFDTVHVRGALHVARQCAAKGVTTLIHISGIGADLKSASAYVRARAEGEAEVRSAFPDATILRPSALFGPGDALFTSLTRIARLLPVLPLFGRGETRLQPVFVGDVAEAAARAVATKEARAKVFELGGPEVFSYRELLELTMRQIGKKPLLLPVPFPVWDLLAATASLLPRPPLTPAQVVLMKSDNVASEELPGLPELDIAPTPVRSVLPDIVGGDAERTPS